MPKTAPVWYITKYGNIKAEFVRKATRDGRTCVIRITDRSYSQYRPGEEMTVPTALLERRELDK